MKEPLNKRHFWPTQSWALPFWLALIASIMLYTIRSSISENILTTLISSTFFSAAVIFTTFCKLYVNTTPGAAESAKKIANLLSFMGCMSISSYLTYLALRVAWWSPLLAIAIALLVWLMFLRYLNNPVKYFLGSVFGLPFSIIFMFASAMAIKYI